MSSRGHDGVVQLRVASTSWHVLGRFRVLPCLLGRACCPAFQRPCVSVECLTFLSVGAFVVEIARVGVSRSRGGGGHASEQAASELVAGLDLNAIEA
jgi:hypothetical protein